MIKSIHPRPTKYTNTYTRKTITPEAWIEALESGEYTKARGLLCRGGTRMCCLGVLADMIGAPFTYPLDGFKQEDGTRYSVTRSYGMIDIPDQPDWLKGKAGDLATRNDTSPGYPIDLIRELCIEGGDA